jgi:hypothetical protein
MARQILEALDGVGEIHAGGELLRRAAYHIEVSTDDAGTRHPSETPAPIVEGRIDVAGMAEALVLAGPQERSLKLQDGRQLAFSLASTSGRIEAHGGLEPSTPPTRS